MKKLILLTLIAISTIGQACAQDYSDLEDRIETLERKVKELKKNS